MFDEEARFANHLITLIIDDAFEKSIIFSPTSILTGLAMFYAGCEGETAAEIQHLIGQGKERNEIIDQFASTLNHYKKSYENAKENVRIKFANKLFISNTCELFPIFCQRIQTNFDGGFQFLNFSDTQIAVMEINNFVEKETNGLITNIIDKNDIDQSTTAVLVNAVYFKAPWELIFEQTEILEFKSMPLRKIKMMFREIPESLYWNYVENDKWTALGIPYENYKAWMYFVLPNENYSLKEMLLSGSSNNNNFRQWTKRQRSPFIRVSIPFMDTQYEINMNEKLEKLGMKIAFTDKCNVTNMTKYPLFLKNVLHKSTITVDEKGTEASAASSCFISLRSARKPTHSFTANRPFLYFITTVKEPISEENAKIKDETYYNDETEEEESYIDVSKCTTEPFNLLFVGTFC